MLFSLRNHWPAVGLLLATVLWRPWPATAQEKLAEPDKAAAEEPAAEEPDPYAVPDGSTAELAKFIERVLGSPPPDAQSRQKAIEAMQEAADRILAGKPNDAEAAAAIQVKTIFAGDPAQLEALVEKLIKDGRKQLARQVRGAVLRRKLRTAGFARSEEAVKDLKELISLTKTYLAEGPLGREEIGLAMSAARAAEMTGDTELATEAYTGFAKLLTASDDERVVAAGKQMEGTLRRLTLPGNEMQLEGTLLAGEKLDWPGFRGKVVLVDFWATWCGPCLREIPNVKELYEAYHDQGFEVVGISLDDDRERLEAFLTEQEIPWKIVHDGGKSVTADYYGVTGIPTMILVGADGKVISTRARGPALREALEKLFGPIEEEKKEEEGDKKKDDV